MRPRRQRPVTAGRQRYLTRLFLAQATTPGYGLCVEAPGEIKGLMCCLCGESGDWSNMFGLGLFPALDVDAFQQWYAHPRCVRTVIHPAAVASLRPELETMWDLE